MYALDEPVAGAGHYYRVYTTEKFNLSSPVQMFDPDQLRAAGVKATMKPSLLIEDFEGDWEKVWFACKPDKWELKTLKVYCAGWKAPEYARLVFELRSVPVKKHNHL